MTITTKLLIVAILSMMMALSSASAAAAAAGSAAAIADNDAEAESVGIKTNNNAMLRGTTNVVVDNGVVDGPDNGNCDACCWCRLGLEKYCQNNNC